MTLGTLSAISIIGILTVIVSLSVKILGFPEQFKKNYLRKSAEGLSFSLIFLMFVSYILWFIYGVLKHDWVLIIPNILGIITSGAVFYQIVLYRKNQTI